MKPLLIIATIAVWLTATSAAGAHSFSTRTLSDAKVGTAKTELIAQRDHSEHVIQFFAQHHWMTAPRHATCWSVPWSKTCNRARAVRRAHLWLHTLSVRRLHRLYPEMFVPSDPRAIICYVFGPYCSQAETVASCESGYRTWAENGQYKGLFQMGDNERAHYATLGYSSAYAQTVAAHNYFVAAHGWGPWECRA